MHRPDKARDEVKRKSCTPDLRKKLLDNFRSDFTWRKRKTSTLLTKVDQLYLRSLKVSFKIGKHRK